MRERRERKSVMERVKETGAVGRRGSTRSAPVVVSEKGSAQKIKGQKEKEMNGVTRMIERKRGIERSVRASVQAKAGVERGSTKVSAQVGSIPGHAPGVVRNQRRRAGSTSPATAKSMCTNTVTAVNAVTAGMTATGKTLRERTLKRLHELTFLTLMFSVLSWDLVMPPPHLSY